ncbi:hypothetical protein CAOG_08637 [Capsaspora owczarzaki ATCC 30864]|nr:hypothetical protein CAOG_08637 [Capsaspora owczarzaki ATCC 30864]|eukprot:XP_011270248.1 hypothetical protein CAOG_08637 [Capsaspora owczarzaki ATCC 30864]
MRSIVTAPKHQSAHPASWNGNAEAGLANGAEPVLHFPPFLCRMRLSRDGTQMVIALRDALLLVSNLNLDTLAEDFGQSQLQWLAEHGFVQHYDLPSKTWQPHSMLSDESADDPPARSRQRNHIELLEESPTRTGVCTTLHFDPSGRFLLTRRSCARDEQSIVFDLHSKRPVEDSPIGERLRSSDSSSRLSQFRELQERPLGSAHVPWIASVTESGTAPEYIKEACFSADGRFIASPYQRTVRVFDFENAFMRYSTHGVQCPELPPILSIPTHHSESVLTCRFSPIMPVLVTAGLDGRVVFYNPQF